MFEFLEIARSYLITTCQQCREWIVSAASTNSGFSPRQKSCEIQEFLVDNEQKSGCNRKTRDINSVSVLQNIVLVVQRVMQRHRKLAMHMQQNSGIYAMADLDTVVVYPSIMFCRGIAGDSMLPIPTYNFY